MPRAIPPTRRRPGRHRRRTVTGWPGRATVLGIAASLVILLTGGIAVAITAATPAGSGPGQDPARVAGLGTAPAQEPAGATPTASPSAAPRATPPAPPTDPPRPTDPPPAEDPPPADEPPPDDDPPDEITRLEDEVAALTNQERSAAGCDPLDTDERLRAAARGHSQDMAEHDYFSHTGRDGSSFVDRARDAGYPSPAGENIAMGYRTPADVMDGWMGSDGHRRNLLNCSHTEIGVGLAYDDAGRPYWTQVFGRD